MATFNWGKTDGKPRLPTTARDGSRARWTQHLGACAWMGGSLLLALAVELGCRRWKSRHGALKESGAEEGLAQLGSRRDHFLAVLSHELRAPLMPALAAVRELSADTRLGEESRALVAMALRNLEHEQRLVDDLLDCSRVANGKFSLDLERVDLRKVIEDCLSDFQEFRAKDIRFSWTWPDGGAVVNGDCVRLRQVVCNLLQNAAKFTPKNGTVTVRLSLIAGDGDGIAPMVLFQIEDSGMGIAAEALGRIFESYQQANLTVHRRFGGLGLGLWICKMIVEAHGGRIVAYSDGEGLGAVFGVYLPLSAGAAEAHLAPNPALHTRVPGRHLLLVEDHHDTAELLRVMLGRAGHRITHAETVRAAFRAAETQGEGARFDLVLSDLQLPDGDGFELMEELSRRFGLRGIALGGSGDRSDSERGRLAGFERYFVKPIDFEELVQAISAVLDSSRGPRA